MASWTKKAWETVVAEHPELEGRSEAVALCVWAYKQDPDFDTADLKAIGEKAGVTVAGRAMGSAREILGLKAKTNRSGAKKTKRKKKKRGAKRGRKRSAASSAGGLDSLSGLVDSMKGLERDHERMRKTLEKIRDAVDDALA